MVNRSALCAAALGVLLAVGRTSAQVSPPSQFQLQGRLTDNAGQPVTSATRDLRVEFYNASVGGLLLGTSAVVDPTITNGVYAVSLDIPAGMFANNVAVYMEMAVGNDAPGPDGVFEVLSPRTRVLASAYALNADTLDGRDSSFFAQSSNSFVQNGNAFGALATLGTNDGNGLAFETAGAERVRIDTTGRMGIGTTTPAGRLDVQDGGLTLVLGADNLAGTRTDATEKVTRITGAHYTNAEEPVMIAMLEPYAATNTLSLGGGSGLANSATEIRFLTAGNTTTTSGTERMRITSSGNVGIGTTAPASRLALGTSGSLAEGLTFGPSGTSGIYTAPNGWLILTNQNGVGKLTLFDSYARADENFIVGNMLRGSGGNTPVRIDTGLNVLAGNVGIGTAAPATYLHVSGPSSVNGTLARFDRTDAGEADLELQSAGAGTFFINTNAAVLQLAAGQVFGVADDPAQFAVTSTGNVGIGTATPNQRLRVTGSAWLDGNSEFGWDWTNTDRASIRFESTGDAPGQSSLILETLDNSDEPIEFRQSGNSRMIIATNGNVGIGTTAPGARLTVVAGATTDTLGANGVSDGFDIAEAISAADDVEVADLVSADPATSQRVVRSRAPYDAALLGVITSQPAIAIGATDGNRHIALAGRVAVRVSEENGPISRGDYLTSSWKPGVAMKATGPGRVVGVALGEFAGEGEGRVVVYVSPGWWDGGRTVELARRVTDLSSRLERAERENDELQKRLTRLEAIVEGKLR